MKLLLVLILVELAFFVWSLATKCIHAKEKTVARRALCLLLVEVMVFALNYWNGAYVSGPAVAVAVAVSVLVIFVTVNLVLWLNDSRSAREFNRELAEFRRRETKF